MTKALMASVALTALALAGCAAGSNGGDVSLPTVSTGPTVQYAPPPPAPAGTGTVVASSGSNEALCGSKGGIVGQWAGEPPAKSCELPNGNAYPLAQLGAFPEFQ